MCMSKVKPLPPLETDASGVRDDGPREEGAWGAWRAGERHWRVLQSYGPRRESTVAVVPANEHDGTVRALLFAPGRPAVEVSAAEAKAALARTGRCAHIAGAAACRRGR